MAGYTNRDLLNASKRSRNKILGLVLIMTSIVLTLLTIIGFPNFVKSFVLGSFGLMFYPIMLITFFVGAALATNKKFVYSAKYVFYLLAAFLCLVAIIHIAVTAKLDNTNYMVYIAECYNYKYTAGGVILGVLTYAVTGLLHSVAGYVLFSILLIVLIVLIIDYLNAVKQYAKLNTPTYVRPAENNIENLSIEAPVQKEQANIDFMTLDDEEDEEEIEKPINQERNFAKEKLGLVAKSKEDETNKREKLYPKDEEDDLEEDKPLFSPKGNIGNSLWNNRSLLNNQEQRNARPPKYSYDDNGNISSSEDNVANYQQRNNPTYNKSKEYLDTIFGGNPNNKNPIVNNENYKEYRNIISSQTNEEPKLNNTFNYNSQPQQNTNLNQTTNINKFNRDGGEVKNSYNEFRKSIVSSNTQQNNYGIEPDLPKINTPAPNIEDVKIQSSGGELKKDNNDTQAFRVSPLNPINFEAKTDSVIVDDVSKNETTVDVIEPDIKVNDVVVETTEKEKLPVTAQYNLPNSLKRSNTEFKQMEIPGAEKSKLKAIVPNFKFSTNYVRPSIDLLKTYQGLSSDQISQNTEEKIEILEKVLEDFGVPAKVQAVRRGATVTRYELQMPTGIPVKKIQAHSCDIDLALAAKSGVRIEAPIRGKSAVGIEVPNDKNDIVGIRKIIDSPKFMESRSALTFALGEDVDGNAYTCDLAKTPHLLVAGSTNSGKSVCLNTLLISLLYRTSPEDMRILLVDPKLVEFTLFNGLPHMLTPKAIYDTEKVMNALDWLIEEMERRYLLLQENRVKNILEYNNMPEVLSKKFPKLPYIVLIIDEFGDIVMKAKKDLEDRIVRLTQKARAAGIHLILATQRPSVDVITGTIKMNLPSRIAFAVSSYVDSNTILGHGGAEKLLGRGDMLYCPIDSPDPIRLQGAYVDTAEINEVVDFIKANNETDYDENIINYIENGKPNSAIPGGNGYEQNSEFDTLMPDALRLVIDSGSASISMLQRRFSIGFSRAARIIDQMELAKFIAPSDGSKTRAVYITMEDYNKIYHVGED